MKPHAVFDRAGLVWSYLVTKAIITVVSQNYTVFSSPIETDKHKLQLYIPVNIDCGSNHIEGLSYKILVIGQ